MHAALDIINGAMTTTDTSAVITTTAVKTTKATRAGYR
jgi:hypothetical protein